MNAGIGSVFITGFAEVNYRDNFTKDEAKTFLKESITTAMKYDSTSGGTVRIADINEHGVKEDIITF